MIAKELISDEIPVVHTTDTGQKVLNLMEVFRVSHLPIVSNSEFFGVVTDSDIYDLNDPELSMDHYPTSLFMPFVYADQHIYEIIALVSKRNLTAIPVLKRNKQYLGVINIRTLVKQFTKLLAVGQPGGIIILELNLNDYSLSQISQIIESNDTKILSLYVNTLEDSMKMNVTIKTNRVDIEPILQTFERYNYTIKQAIVEGDETNNLMENRYEEFMRYLSV